jgi:hypothetical protein
MEVHMKSQKQVIASIALALLTVPASAAPIVNVLAGSPQQFGEMDLATGTFSPIGPVPGTIQYLVPGPNASLLTMSFNGDLDSINRMTGATSVIGPTGFADCSTPSTPSCGPNSQLSFGMAAGTLYATSFANNLYTVNPATGKATLVGVTGIPAVPFVPASTNPDGSFNFYDENLFGVGGKLYANFDAATFNPATSVFTTVIAPALYQIDAGTGHASKIASTDLGLITITDLNGTIYGFNGVTNQVVTLDVTNGTTSFVSNIDASAGLVGGAAPTVPEPASIALAAIGIASIVFSRRRKRHASRVLSLHQR